MELGAFIAPRRYPIPTRLLRDEGWSLEDPRVLTLLEKIRSTGVPLKEYCKADIYRGPVTGLNEAFFIDGATRDRLIAEDKRSKEIIKPLLRGRDIDRWRRRPSDLFMICARRGIDIDDFRAIKKHLNQFRLGLEPKPKGYNDADGQWAGRRAGDYRWYELQDNIPDSMMLTLSKTKIIYQELAWFSEFALDDTELVPNNTAYLISTGDPELLVNLNSPMMWWYMWRTAQHGKDEVLRLFTEYFVNIPIARYSAASSQDLRTLTEEAVRQTDLGRTFEVEVQETIGDRFGCPNADRRVISWLPMPSEKFAAHVFKLAENKRPTARAVEELVAFQSQARPRQVELLTRQIEIERKLAALVEEAYGLTREERALLRSTRPIRDPLDVLEGRIRGGGEVAAGDSAEE